MLMFLYRFKALETIMAGKEEMNRCDKRVSFSSSAEAYSGSIQMPHAASTVVYGG